MSATVSTETQLVSSGDPSLSDTGYGTFGEHLSLDFYEDCSFSNIDTSGVQVVGEKVCLGVTWNGNPIGEFLP